LATNKRSGWHSNDDLKLRKVFICSDAINRYKALNA
jgi:hypothetical protein